MVSKTQTKRKPEREPEKEPKMYLKMYPKSGRTVQILPLEKTATNFARNAGQNFLFKDCLKIIFTDFIPSQEKEDTIEITHHSWVIIILLNSQRIPKMLVTKASRTSLS